MNKKMFSIVVPVYQNELNLHKTIPSMLEYSDKINSNYDTELVFVEDGSVDNSFKILDEYQKKYPQKIKVIKLTRNFGQFYALMAGFDHSSGDVIGKINADMQEPIETFSQMLKKHEQGYKLVLGARSGRKDKGVNILFAKLARLLESKLIDSRLPRGGTDFYLFDKEILNHMKTIKQKNGSIPAMLLWLGYNFTTVDYVRLERKDGKSGWTLKKKLKQIIDTYTTNSSLPLKFISTTGIVSAIISFLYGFTIIIKWLLFPDDGGVEGWRSLVVLISFFSGLILFSLGIIGEYIWKMFDYIKDRPQYIIEEIYNEKE